MEFNLLNLSINNFTIYFKSTHRRLSMRFAMTLNNLHQILMCEIPSLCVSQEVDVEEKLFDKEKKRVKSLHIIFC